LSQAPVKSVVPTLIQESGSEAKTIESKADELGAAAQVKLSCRRRSRNPPGWVTIAAACHSKEPIEATPPPRKRIAGDCRRIWKPSAKNGASIPIGGSGFCALKTIYFDYNATTPLDPGCARPCCRFWTRFLAILPAPITSAGGRGRLLDDARERVAKVWRCKPSEVVFSSGGTESNNLAVLGTARLLRDKGRHLITSTIEHHAVLHCFEYLAKHEGFNVTYLPVNAEGLVSPDDLKKAIRPDTILVSLMSANNEMGAIQPVAEFGEICRSRGVLFHTDALQSFGKEPFTASPIQRRPGFLLRAQTSRPQRSGRAFHQIPAAS
jgi:hypothetical protein